ncbi:MAG: hypothetical protein ACE5KM_12305, partial [Planctomycetaceae bacterium]
MGIDNRSPSWRDAENTGRDDARREPVEARRTGTRYNIEVEGDHVYRVGESGVLVHNTSAPDCDCEIEFSITGTNPNDLVASKVSGSPSTGNGVYVKKHFDKTKVGSASNFRTRYTLSDPKGGCNRVQPDFRAVAFDWGCVKMA